MRPHLELLPLLLLLLGLQRRLLVAPALLLHVLVLVPAAVVPASGISRGGIRIGFWG
jgi:hypothetical protein